MYRALGLLALSLGIAPALSAQEKLTAAQQQSITGKWLLDVARSDTVPGDPMSRGIGGRAFGGGGGSRPSGGGGGSGRGRGSGGGAPPPPAGDTTTAPPPPPMGGGGGGNPAVKMALAEANPGGGIIFAVNDSIVAIATAAQRKMDPNAVSNWKTDGKKHQEAQMDGTILETQAGWKEGVLTIMNGVVGAVTVKREFKWNKDGKTLELKETIEQNGKKAEYKLVFNRS